MSDKVSAIRIKVEGYLTYVPTIPEGETIQDALDIDLDAANDDPYEHVMAMMESDSADLEFSGEIVEVEVDENGKIVPEAKE